MIKINPTFVAVSIGIFIVYVFRNTCILNNHHFIVQKNIATCDKCGLAKRIVRK